MRNREGERVAAVAKERLSRDEEQLSKLLRGVEEVVTEEELRAALEDARRRTAYVGYEPSGSIHLGHMITALKLAEFQRLGFKAVVLLADLHAHLNEKGSLEVVRKIAERNKECFRALLGNVKVVLGSSFQLNADYIRDVLRLATLTTLSRARRSMDEISRSVENPKVSQMIYPLMQAMDIAYLDADVAIGGIDQRKIHMLARESLPKLGFKAPVCVHLPLILGLDGEKMSSSKGNFIAIDDDEATIAAKIRKAVCPPKATENNPVLQLYELLIFPVFETVEIERDAKYGGDVSYESFHELEKDYVEGELHPLDLKLNAARYVDKLIEPARQKLKR